MSGDGPHVVIADDDEAICELIRFPLEQEGYRVTIARDGVSALEAASRRGVDLVILDVMMPRLDGMEVCRRVRAVSDVPILMLTARSDELDRVLGLEIGADDYVVKENLSIRELTSRVRAILRRMRRSAPEAELSPDVIAAGELVIDTGRRSVSVRGAEIELSHFEYEILVILARHPGRVYSRQLLLQLVWGTSDYRDERTVDVHVHYLRNAVEEDPKRPRYIRTVRHVGYRFGVP